MSTFAEQNINILLKGYLKEIRSENKTCMIHYHKHVIIINFSIKFKNAWINDLSDWVRPLKDFLTDIYFINIMLFHNEVEISVTQ